MHAVARTGFNAVGASGLYDSARPSYPIQATLAILNACVPDPPRPVRIVEIGAGTGISTRALLEASSAKTTEANPSPIASIRVIEPSEGMRRDFGRNVVEKYKGQSVDLTVEDGTFEEFNAGRSPGADCLFSAQAFHWCLDHDRFVQNAAQTLRPGGVLALLWNMEDRDADRHGTWRRLLSNPLFLKHFAPLDELHVRRTIPTTLQGVKDRVLSKSYVSILPPVEKQSVLDSIEKILSPADEAAESVLGRVWIDREKGVWEYVS
ncbi:hypothetical protein HDU93_002625 [Gonapodya sp. JEL0774]|nr:hypothetical protein HDU93_002625 [Gonapodya sp. JEL0774]